MRGKTTAKEAKPEAKKKPAAKRTRKKKVDPWKPLVITGELFWRWRALSAELLEKRAIVRRIEAERNLEAQNPIHKPLLQLDGDLNEAQVDLNTAQIAFCGLQKDVAKSLGIDHDGLIKRTYTINPDTGELVFLPEQEG